MTIVLLTPWIDSDVEWFLKIFFVPLLPTLRLDGLDISDREDPFAAIIRCTADPAKADKRTRSKWSRLMRYAAAYKLNSEPLDRFIKRKGGINECAARFSRRLGRRTKKRVFLRTC